MGVRIIIAPEPIYCATDACRPRWRFILAAVNTSRGILQLERANVTIHDAKKRRRRTYSGDRLTQLIVQGNRRLRRRDLVALEIQDSGSVRRARRVCVSMTFAGKKAGHPVVSGSVELSERRTVWLDFPMAGRWLAVNAREDYHCLGSQFGFDFIAAEDRILHEEKPPTRLRLREFASFRRPIFSPAAGTVISCARHYPDFKATPGRPTYGTGAAEELGKLVGNHVAIALEQGQYLLLAHMRRGSVRVRAGDIVGPGQKIGEVGNSGNTTGPHLHIELMDRMPDLTSSLPARRVDVSGLPFGFRNLDRVRRAQTRRMRRCVPRKGDIVQSRR